MSPNEQHEPEGVLAQLANQLLKVMEGQERRVSENLRQIQGQQAEINELRRSNTQTNGSRVSSDWVKFGMGLLISGLIAWGTAQGKVAVLEEQLLQATRRIESMENQLRELTREVDRIPTK